MHVPHDAACYQAMRCLPDRRRHWGRTARQLQSAPAMRGLLRAMPVMPYLNAEGGLVLGLGVGGLRREHTQLLRMFPVMSTQERG